MSHEHAPTHAVLFDVGYTLLDETPRLRHALEWCAAQLAPRGTSHTYDDLNRTYNACCAAPAHKSLLVQMLLELGVTADDAAELRRACPWDAAPLVPFTDTVPALQRLFRAGLKLGVLANQPASALDDLRRTHLAGYFDAIWLSDAVGLAKPDPAFFRLALDAWGLPPERIAYVGDRPDNDVRPAKALGMHTLLLRIGPHACQPPRDEAETPHATATTLTDAADQLIRWAHNINA